MNRFSETLTYGFPGPIMFGCGAIKEVGREIRKLGGSRPFVVTGPHLAGTDAMDRLSMSIKEAGLEAIVYQDSTLNPTDTDVKTGILRYREAQCDVIVAVGGGSRMDFAKGIRLLAAHSGDLEDYYFDNGGLGRITSKMPALICIPTTAGSGSEVSRGTIITDTAQNRKRIILGPGMMSSLAILDPELTVSMSPELTAISGLDALSHALETSVGKQFNLIAEGLSRQAAAILYRYLPRAVEDGKNLEARAHVLMASAMAALGFAKGLGVVHSLAHQLSPEADLAHGLAIAIVLPHGMQFNKEVAVREYADLARAMGITTNGTPESEAAEAAIEGVADLGRRFRLPRTLSQAGVKRASLPKMAANAMLDHCHRTNPRTCTEGDMKRLFELAF